MPCGIGVLGAFNCSNMPPERAARTQRVMDKCTDTDPHHDLLLVRTDQYLISQYKTCVTMPVKGVTAD
jgi:hypothetical protein